MTLLSRERKHSADDGFSCGEDVGREFGTPSGRSSSAVKRERSRLTRYRAHCPSNILVFAWSSSCCSFLSSPTRSWRHCLTRSIGGSNPPRGVKIFGFRQLRTLGRAFGSRPNARV